MISQIIYNILHPRYQTHMLSLLNAISTPSPSKFLSEVQEDIRQTCGNFKHKINILGEDCTTRATILFIEIILR
jgi:hypothetical protein